jgi:hypothetical protein
MLALPSALERQKGHMQNSAKECAAMAANMLDAELMAIARKISDDESRTPLQQAVEDEVRRRNFAPGNVRSGPGQAPSQALS